jgi:hypothetical protein
VSLRIHHAYTERASTYRRDTYLPTDTPSRRRWGRVFAPSPTTAPER